MMAIISTLFLDELSYEDSLLGVWPTSVCTAFEEGLEVDLNSIFGSFCPPPMCYPDIEQEQIALLFK